MTLEDGIRQLDSLGVADVLLPFILIFTIVFAILQKTKLLGDGKKQFNVIVAMVLGFSVIIPHVLGTYPPGADVVIILNDVLPNISLALVAILAVLLMMGVWGAEVKLAGTGLGGWVMMVSLAFVFFIFGSSAGWFNLPNFLGFLDDPGTVSLIVIILVFGVIISFITSDDDVKKKENGITNMFKEIIK